MSEQNMDFDLANKEILRHNENKIRRLKYLEGPVKVVGLDVYNGL